MPKLLAVNFSETSRSILCLILSVANWISILISLGLIILGAYIKLHVETFTTLVEGYDGNTFPFLVIGVGLFSLILNIISGFLFYMINFPEKRTALQYFLFVYIAGQILIAVAFLSSGGMCYYHSNHLEDTFQNGINNALKRYKLEGIVKLEIDLLQSTFHCCGNIKYTDWFSVDWIPDDFKRDFAFDEPVVYEESTGVSISPGVTRAVFHHDHVPASCCDYNHTRPCIHTDVHDNPRHANYFYDTQLTLYKTGCKTALMDYFGDTVLAFASYGIFAVFAVQIFLVILTRYLQTSMMEALATGDALAPSQGYLLTYGKDIKEATEDEEGEDKEEESEKKALLSGEEKVATDEDDPMAIYNPVPSPKQSPHGSLSGVRRSSRLLEKAQSGSMARMVHYERRPSQERRSSVYSRHSAIMSPTPHHPAAYDQAIYDENMEDIYSPAEQYATVEHQEMLYDPRIPPPPPPPPLPNF